MYWILLEIVTISSCYKYLICEWITIVFACLNFPVCRLRRQCKITSKNCNLQINKYSNQIACVFQKAGYVKGDAVALMVSNRPEYVGIWLGLGKLGVVTALINTNLRLQSLIHCFRIAQVKSIIYMEEYTSGKYNNCELMITVLWTRWRSGRR